MECPVRAKVRLSWIWTQSRTGCVRHVRELVRHLYTRHMYTNDVSIPTFDSHYISTSIIYRPCSFPCPILRFSNHKGVMQRINEQLDLSRYSRLRHIYPRGLVGVVLSTHARGIDMYLSIRERHFFACPIFHPGAPLHSTALSALRLALAESVRRESRFEQGGEIDEAEKGRPGEKVGCDAADCRHIVPL